MSEKLEPTDQQRADVLACVALDVPFPIMARMVGCSIPTLRRAFKAELTGGKAHVEGVVAGALMARIKAGDTDAMKFYLARKHGWVETKHIAGPGGGAIPVAVDLSGLSLEELEQLAAIRAKLDAATG